MDEDIESCKGTKYPVLPSSLEWTSEFGESAHYTVNKNNKPRNQRRPHSLSISWNSQSTDKTDPISPALRRWFNAVSKICKSDEDIDPWHDFPVDSIKSEKAIRNRYSAIKKKWVQDEIWIKLETLPFDHGAMRECFRLKKLSTTGVNNNHDWNFSSNYVAKQYINIVNRDVYFEDVKLQMESKLWAEEYNRQNPPKKIDIFQLSIIELIDRENKPLYHIEHFMEGTYLKYNSNSGYVDDSCLRNTPQAFSHFTFERSGHRIIIVDIQGVGDLYTDPQIHTADGLNYGDGNLGLRGMALFFSSHRCNSICHFLGLSEFDMHPNELIDNDLDNEITDNEISAMSIDVPPEEDSCVFSSKSYNEFKKRNRSISFKMVHHELARLHESGRFIKSKQLAAGCLHHQFWSHLLNENDSPEAIVKETSNDINWESCLFHERHAAQLGCLEAVIVMARYCLNMSGHMLQDCPFPPTQNDLDCGLDYLWRAADSGDRRSMIELANLYRKTENTEEKTYEGNIMKTLLDVNWYEAVKWYKRAFEAANKPDGQLDSKDAEGRYDSADDLMPPQEILAAMAELHFKGGYGLERNCQLAGELYSQAAEIATNALQGRQAVKYYELSDIAYSQDECSE